MLTIGIMVVLIMASLAAFAYWSFSPKYVDEKAVAVFNRASMMVVVLLTVLFYLNGKTMLPLSDSLREIMSLIFAFCFELFLLVLLFVVRNFWIFKPPRR